MNRQHDRQGYQKVSYHQPLRKTIRQMAGAAWRVEDWLVFGAGWLADAGFTGHDLLSELGRRGIEFLIRVESNVRLLEKLGYAVDEHDGIVYPWPSRQ